MAAKRKGRKGSLVGRARDTRGRLLPKGGRRARANPAKARKSRAPARAKGGGLSVQSLAKRVTGCEQRLDGHASAIREITRVVEDHDRSITYVMGVVRERLGSGPVAVRSA